jgi:hypothetical protein
LHAGYAAAALIAEGRPGDGEIRSTAIVLEGRARDRAERTGDRVAGELAGEGGGWVRRRTRPGALRR